MELNEEDLAHRVSTALSKNIMFDHVDNELNCDDLTVAICEAIEPHLNAIYDNGYRSGMLQEQAIAATKREAGCVDDAAFTKMITDAPSAEGPGEANSGTMDCPVCGVSKPHSHSDEQVCNWLEAQASRFHVNIRIIPRKWEQVLVDFITSGKEEFSSFYDDICKRGLTWLLTDKEGHDIFNAWGKEKWFAWECYKRGMQRQPKREISVVDEAKLLVALKEASFYGKQNDELLSPEGALAVFKTYIEEGKTI